MSQLNSGINTKSCCYDFSKEGPMGIVGGSPVYAFSGIGFKPGEAVIDVRVSKELNLTSAGGSGTTFSLGLGNFPASTFFLPVFSDTLANINTFGWNLNQNNANNTSFRDLLYARFPATLSLSFNLFFKSTDFMTAGKVNFIVTYLYTKF